MGLMLIAGQNLQAQSFLPAQTLLSPGYQFAALTGYHGAWQINGLYRNQWPGIPANFQTFLIQSDAYVNAISSGVGITYFNDVAGSKILNTQELRLTIAPRFQLGNNFVLLTGLGYGYGIQRIDWGQITLGDMIDPLT